MNVFLNKAMIYLHELISKKSTGNPKKLALKLGCSERTAKYKINQLREAGLPVHYCKERESYCYEERVELSLGLKLGDQEMKRIIGGGTSGSLFLQGQCRCPGTLEFCNGIREHPGTMRLYPHKAAHAEKASGRQDRSHLNLFNYETGKFEK